MKIDFENLMKDMKDAPNESIFMLHACAHNPSGIDLSRDQWKQIMELFKEKKHIPLFDIAYQGFATGSFEDDGFAVRMFVENKVECVIAQSFAKNFGLYGERIGACHVVHNGDETLSKNIQGSMCLCIRQTWSMSPIHGAYIVQTIGLDPELKK